ncbi:MAG: hypothetical protein ACE5QF_04280 [Thermoplasmata archaeon]
MRKWSPFGVLVLIVSLFTVTVPLLSDVKAELPVERVEGSDPSSPPHFLRVLKDSDVLLAGRGYWVKLSVGAKWIVSNA